MINAETQLMYASDYPHWDMDLPSTIYDLPFLSETAKRNILGGNAKRVFNLELRRYDLPEVKTLRCAGGGAEAARSLSIFVMAGLVPAIFMEDADARNKSAPAAE